MGSQPLDPDVIVPSGGYSFLEMLRRLFAEVFIGNSHPPLKSRMDAVENKANDIEQKVRDIEKCIDTEIKADITIIKADLLTISRISKYLLTPLMIAIATGIGILIWAVITHQPIYYQPTVIP